ncbi:hypothetical protein LINGRAHAP2_LOCUS20524, partial [Linum grandiflorum]
SLSRGGYPADSGGDCRLHSLSLSGLRNSSELISGEVQSADRHETKGETTTLSHH